MNFEATDERPGSRKKCKTGDDVTVREFAKSGIDCAKVLPDGRSPWNMACNIRRYINLLGYRGKITVHQRGADVFLVNESRVAGERDTARNEDGSGTATGIIPQTEATRK